MTYYYCRAIRERKLCQGQDLTRNVSWLNIYPGLMLNVLQCHRGWHQLMYITFYKYSTVTLAVYFIPFLRYCQFYAEMTLLGDCNL